MKKSRYVGRNRIQGWSVATLCVFWAFMVIEIHAESPPLIQQRRQSAEAAEPVQRPSAHSSEKRPFTEKAPVVLPFHVLNNRILPPVANFALSGFMGDSEDLRVAGSYSSTRTEGFPVMRVQYAAKGKNGWTGAVWQNPANNWGTFDGGYNLSKAKTLAFWAKGEKGGEIVEFTVGGAASNFPDSDTISTGPVVLNEEWTEYTLPLDAYQTFYIATGFGLVLKQDQNPYGCVFYLDEIRYE
ncbi:MAG: hypothetical protein EOM20_05645 [Spartobacteria bacterium]|nr:hypothetical protein [Spartobacteria bacterium]